MNKNKITINHIQQMKINNEPISMVTAYDYSFAKLIESTQIPMILVGDSMGNTILGFDSTIPVKIDDIVRSTQAFKAGCPDKFIIADLPFLSYQIDPKNTLLNVKKLIQDGGADAVKLEGGKKVADIVKRITDAGVPVMGHIGLTPQSVNQLGGYIVQGKTKDSGKVLIDDAIALEKSGAFSIVLELIPSELSKQITKSIEIPTIGIGAGINCDGQVQVLHDILGLNPTFTPKHSKKYANLSEVIINALKKYDADIKKNKFPNSSNSFFTNK